MPLQTPDGKPGCKTLLSLRQDPASPAHLPAAHQPSCRRYPPHYGQPALPRGWGRELGSWERCLSHTRHHKCNEMSLIASASQGQKDLQECMSYKGKNLVGADMAQASRRRTVLAAVLLACGGGD